MSLYLRSITLIWHIKDGQGLDFQAKVLKNISLFGLERWRRPCIVTNWATLHVSFTGNVIAALTDAKGR
jgi:hypothetical protein